MKKLASLISLSALTSTVAYADPVVFGKLNGNLQLTEEGDSSYSEFVNNASRLGVKGTQAIEGSNLEAVYHLEYGVEVDDGADSDGNALTQRNVFLGLKGDFGLIKAGKFDSPLKSAQNKIDLFGDQVGDIASAITVNDNRVSNIVAYTTPKMGVVSATIAVVPSEDENTDDGISTSISADMAMGLYLAFAFDSNIEVARDEAYRLVAQYRVKALQLGFLAESYDSDSFNGTQENGVFASLQYTIGKVALKGQFGQSDIKFADGETYSVGADYKFSKKVKSFVFFTSNNASAIEQGKYLGTGLEVKF